VKHRDERLTEIARWLEIPLDPGQRASLLRYEEWLADEAVAAGGIGPHEAERLLDRHILDSLAYLRGFPSDTGTVLDVGGGVGLPSIPIAIVQPHLEVTMIDRSERRTSLARRARRILGVENLEITMRDVRDVETRYDVLTFRASLRIGAAATTTKRLTRPGGLGLVGVSRRDETPTVPSAPEGVSFTLSSEGVGVLDSPFWLLRMHHS